MMKKILSAILFLGLSVPLVAQAQPKIGYMDSQEVMQNLPKRKNMQQKLSNYAKQQNKTYTQQATNYQKAMSKFQKNKSSMSESEKDTTKKELVNMKTSLNKLSNKLRQKLQQKRSELINPILQKINDAITAIAEKNDLDFVLNKSVSGSGNVIIYASDNQMDITQQVIDYVKSNS